MCKDFDTLIKETWCNQLQVSMIFCRIKKMHLLKTKAKEWNCTIFSNVFRQIALVDSQLEKVQNRITLDPCNNSLVDRQERLLTKRRDIFLLQANYWENKDKKIH